jgi:hypothetical protein
MRVLFVNDEALIVLLATSSHEDLGCEVETALNAPEATAETFASGKFSRGPSAGALYWAVVFIKIMGTR